MNDSKINVDIINLCNYLKKLLMQPICPLNYLPLCMH